MRKFFAYFFFIGVPLLPLVVFWFLPMGISVWLSFTNWDYISPQFDYVLMENYMKTFTSNDFYKALWNTLFFSVFTVFPSIVIGLLLALLINQKLKGELLFKVLLFSPWITPMVAMSIVWAWIYQPDIGLFNQTLAFFHLPQPNWLNDPKTAMWAIIIVTVWKSAGWIMIFYLDALSKIPHELYQVGDIEGTNGWQKFRYITFPLISPTTLFLVIISSIDAIQAYDQIQVMTQGGPAGSTRTLLYLYYQVAFEQFNMGEATALATIIVLLTSILAFILFKMSKRYVHY